MYLPLWQRSILNQDKLSFSSGQEQILKQKMNFQWGYKIIKYDKSKQVWPYINVHWSKLNPMNESNAWKWMQFLNTIAHNTGTETLINHHQFW